MRARLLARPNLPPVTIRTSRCFGAAAVPAGDPLLNAVLERELQSESIDANRLKLSTTDLLVPASMKNAAKCDT